jgi:hypothetical protein
MPAKEPFHPKAKTPSIERRTKNDLFQNPPSYPQLGGLSSTGKYPSPDRPLALEKGELTRKGKPI